MLDILRRESIYIFYYLSILIRLIAPFWALGILIGSAVSVFGKEKLNESFLKMQEESLGIAGIVPAALLGILSPLCMYGTIPIASSFSRKGMREDWLAAFMMSSMLLNPQLLIYSAALGKRMMVLRFLFSLLGGITAGLVVRIFYADRPFFQFTPRRGSCSRDTHPRLFIRYILNVYRNVKATGFYFLIGIVLTAVYQRYVPSDTVTHLFGSNRGFGILIAATAGVPLYMCGGGTIPLLVQWLAAGMSPGSAMAFMLSGPSTKITNLSALKSAFTTRHFVFYLLFALLFALSSGFLIELIYHT